MGTKLNITTGSHKIGSINREKGHVNIDRAEDSVYHASTYFGAGISELEAVNNASIFCDAMNTYQSTGKLPSELYEMNKYLISIIETVGQQLACTDFDNLSNLCAKAYVKATQP